MSDKNYILNKAGKLYNHLVNGTLIDRIKADAANRHEQRWIRFQQSGQSYIDRTLAGNLKIRLYKNSELSVFIYFDKLEPEEISFLKKFLKPGDTFLDVGANVGLFSLHAASLVGKTGKVYSFEPYSKTFERLVENIQLNHLPNVAPMKIALSEAKGSSPMFVSTDGFDAWNSLGTPSMGAAYATEDVILETLDNFVSDQRLCKGVSLVKIDVEGWEIPVLKGAVKTLSEPDAPVLIVEFTEQNAVNAGFSCRDLYNLLTSYGYGLFRYNSRANTLTSEVMGENQTYDNYANLIACKDVRQISSRFGVSVCA